MRRQVFYLFYMEKLIISSMDDTVWHFEKNSTCFVKKGAAESLERIDILDPSGGQIGKELVKREGKGD